MINTQEEVAMCDECISHIMENVGPDHVIVKYREALIELDRLRKIAACFRQGDAAMIQEFGMLLHAQCAQVFPKQWALLNRCQAAAKLAEDSCK